jgi:hypothetical protein
MNWGLEGLLDVLLRSGMLRAYFLNSGGWQGFAALMLGIAFGLFKRRV